MLQDFQIVAVVMLLGGTVLFLLLVAGWIGTKKQRESVRRSIRWEFQHRLFFPFDPYKSIPDAIDEAAANALPTKERKDYWLPILRGIALMFIIPFFVALLVLMLKNAF